MQTLSEAILTREIEMVRPFANADVYHSSPNDVAEIKNSGLTRITRTRIRHYVHLKLAIFAVRRKSTDVEMRRRYNRGKGARGATGKGTSLKSRMMTHSEGVIEEGIIKPSRLYAIRAIKRNLFRNPELLPC